MEQKLTNKIQIDILCKVSKNQRMRFSELNQGEYPSDQFSYHLRHLVKNHLLEKHDDKSYTLTPDGRNHMLMLDKNIRDYIMQGLIGIRVIVTRTTDHGEEVLLQKRRHEPNFGLYALPGGRVLFGELVEDAVPRVVQIETGLVGEYILLGIRHIVDQVGHDMAQDKYFFVFTIQRGMGTMLEEGPSGPNTWVCISELEQHPDLLHGVPELVAMKQGESDFFKEYK